MTPALRVGLVLVLPSGNRVVLRAVAGASWVCEYTRDSAARGEVEFSARYLQRFGRETPGR